MLQFRLTLHPVVSMLRGMNSKAPGWPVISVVRFSNLQR
jgi:hypothetical protein